MKLKYIINDNNKYSNIKEILKQEFQISDRLLLKLKKSNQIFKNDIISSIYDVPQLGDIVTVDLDLEEESENIISTEMSLNILFEDESFLIVNKPPFVPVHPSMDHYTDSLSNGIKYYFDSIGLKRKIRPVNRLDKNTSGIVIFAKNQYVQECLIKQMKNDTFIKEYLAILSGILNEKSKIVNAPIARKENSIIERCVSPSGAEAITVFENIKNFTDYTLVKCILKTGRTHQIRVHSSYIGNPILGDDLYGNSSNLINRQALHCYRIKFIHPISKKIIEIICDLLDDMKNLIQ